VVGLPLDLLTRISVIDVYDGPIPDSAGVAFEVSQENEQLLTALAMVTLINERFENATGTALAGNQFVFLT